MALDGAEQSRVALRVDHVGAATQYSHRGQRPQGRRDRERLGLRGGIDAQGHAADDHRAKPGQVAGDAGGDLQAIR